MVSKWSLGDPPVKSYILPIHRNGRGQTGKFMSPNIFWPDLESFVLPLSTAFLKTKRADEFAEESYFIEVRPLTSLHLTKRTLAYVTTRTLAYVTPFIQNIVTSIEVFSIPVISSN